MAVRREEGLSGEQLARRDCVVLTRWHALGFEQGFDTKFSIMTVPHARITPASEAWFEAWR